MFQQSDETLRARLFTRDLTLVVKNEPLEYAKLAADVTLRESLVRASLLLTTATWWIVSIPSLDTLFLHETSTTHYLVSAKDLESAKEILFSTARSKLNIIELVKRNVNIL